MLGDDSIDHASLLLYHDFPVKNYVFSENYDELYGTPEAAVTEVEKCLNSLFFEHGIDMFSNKEGHAIAFPWGFIHSDIPYHNVDLYVFEYDKHWNECNPEWDPYIFEEGMLKLEGFKGCETGVIILGKEARLRRQHARMGRNRENYIYDRPMLGHLGPKNRLVEVFQRPTVQD